MTLKFLLVGKDKSDFEIIKEAFDNEDANIIVATSIGLALFLARKNQPHLIICQQELADSDAPGFFSELQSEPELANIPFVFLLGEENKKHALKIFNQTQHKLTSKDSYNERKLVLPSNTNAKLPDLNKLKSEILAFIIEKRRDS